MIATGIRCHCGKVATVKSSDEGTHYYANEDGSEHVCTPSLPENGDMPEPYEFKRRLERARKMVYVFRARNPELEDYTPEATLTFYADLADSLRTRLEQAERDTKEMRAIGHQLACLAFNWSQMPANVPHESDRITLRRLCDAWDSAIAASHPTPQQGDKGT